MSRLPAPSAVAPEPPRVPAQLLSPLLQLQFTVCELQVNVAPDTLIAERLIRTVHEHYANPALSLKTIAVADRRSSRYLGRLFNKFTGLPFRTYLRSVRIDYAARLLLTSEQEVKTIAGMTGYNDPSRFCTASAPFFRKLSGKSGKDFKIVAVLPQSLSESREYLHHEGVQVDQVKEISLGQVGVMATPTMLLLNNSGIVRKAWIGELNPDQQKQALNAIGAFN